MTSHEAMLNRMRATHLARNGPPDRTNAAAHRAAAAGNPDDTTRRALAESLAQLALDEFGAGEFEQSITTLDEVVHLYRDLARDRRLALALLVRSHVNGILRRPLSAVADAQNALHLLIRAEAPDQIGLSTDLHHQLAYAALSMSLAGYEPELVLRMTAVTKHSHKPLDSESRSHAARAASLAYIALRDPNGMMTALVQLVTADPDGEADLSRDQALAAPMGTRLGKVLHRHPALYTSLRGPHEHPVLLTAEPRWLLPHSSTGSDRDEVAAELLSLLRKAKGLDAVTLGLEIHALHAIDGKPTETWSHALALLSRAYEKSGGTAQLADAQDWLARFPSLPRRRWWQGR
ncbi:hypothetical protein [Actinokineospora enzanensis]|uniref:hypothetical protein n=1 Tax=Actinokineospora enzanensis TaxID=155975 RepID=UPI00037F0CF3|nr:hypothetical protein [Actinokineospora enzanensis]